MDLIIISLAGFFILLGIAGSFLPVIPGPLTSWLGLFILGFAPSIVIENQFLILCFCIALFIFIFDNIIAVQLKGTMFGCQVFGQKMLEQGRGSIINISSASAGPPLSKAFTYSVAKAGIKNLTQNLAREWATKGVRVNALRPGFFPTEWSQEHFITPEREEAILRHTPMRRYGEPRELVGAVIWLASDAASFVTGAEIAVDGGFSAMTI